MPPTPARDLEILDRLEANPDATQAALADQLGVAVGTVNYALRRLISKGYVRAQQMQRRKLRYRVTPAGVALRARLAVDSLNYGMRLYRETRAQAQALIKTARRHGFARVKIEGEGDLADIARLTCMSLKVPVRASDARMPVIYVDGLHLALRLPLSKGDRSR